MRLSQEVTTMTKKLKKLLIDDAEITLVGLVTIAFFVGLATFSAS